MSLYLTHIGYLSLVHFDYGYNMAANVVAGDLLYSGCYFNGYDES